MENQGFKIKASTYFLVAFITMSTMAYMNFLPSIIDALANKIGFTPNQAGQIMAMNGYGGLLGLASAIFIVGRLPWQKSITMFLVFMIALDIFTPAISKYYQFMVGRFLSGMFGGLAMGIMFAVIAQLSKPDRAYGLLLFLQFSIGALVVYLIPSLENAISPYVTFYIMAVVATLGLACQKCLPVKLDVLQPTGSKGKIGVNRGSVMLFVVIFIYQLAASAIWAYAGQIGHQINLSAQTISNIIALTGVSGLIGALAPILKNSPRHYISWVSIGIILSGISPLLINYAPNMTNYAAGLLILFLPWPAVIAYLLATVARQDPSGRLSTIAGLISIVGLASGPMLAASLIRHDQYTQMLLTCAMIFFVSLILIVFPFRGLNHHNSASTRLVE